MLCTIVSELKSITRPFFCLCWGGGGWRRALLPSLLQNGQKPRRADIRGQVSDWHHTAEDMKKALPARPREAPRGEQKLSTFTQRLMEQQRFVWEGISHTRAQANVCVCVCVSVCLSVQVREWTKWRKIGGRRHNLQGFEGESRCESPSFSPPSHSVANSLCAASNRSWGRPLISRQKEWGG